MKHQLVTEEWPLNHSVAQQHICAGMEICNFRLKCHLLFNVNKNANLCFLLNLFFPICCVVCCLCGAFSTGNVCGFFFLTEPFPHYSPRFWPTNNSAKDINNGSYLIGTTSLGLGKYMYYNPNTHLLERCTYIFSCFQVASRENTVATRHVFPFLCLQLNGVETTTKMWPSDTWAV